MTVSLAIVGAGSRGLNTYPQLARDSKIPIVFTAVAEPRDDRREKAIQELKIPRENAFRTWEELAAKARLADGVILATQDAMHAAPAQALLSRGYHVLLEKPMATTEADC